MTGSSELGQAMQLIEQSYCASGIEHAVDSIKQISDTGDNISASFQMVIDQLQELVYQQDQLLEASTRLHHEQEQVAVNTMGTADFTTDIELF